jgi:sialidase-1
VFGALCGCAAPAPTPGPCAGLPVAPDEASDVFLPGDGGVPVWRIPAIAATASGALLAVAEGRQSIDDPGAGGIVLASRRSADCGRTWSDVVVLDANGTGDSHNPGLVSGVDADGAPTTWLLFSRRPKSDGGEADLPPGLGLDSATAWLISSDDDGLGWSAPRELTAQVKDPAWAIFSFGPGGAVQTRWGDHPGRLTAPGWYTRDGAEGSFVITSDDFGATWALGGVPEAVTNEAQVVERKDGALLLDARQNAGDVRQVFSSDDGGASWSAPAPGLAMTPVMSSVVRARDDLLLHSGPLGPGRTDMAVWASEDEGATWGAPTVLLEGFAQYSALAPLDDGSVGLVVETLGDGFSVRWLRFALADLGLR